VSQVLVTLHKPESAGNVPMPGHIRATPTRRRTVGAAIVLPIPFTVPLAAGVVTVELAANGADWCWRIEELTSAMATMAERYVAVPESGTTLGYEDLVDVDPDTLDPAVEPEAAWTVALRTLPGWRKVETGEEERPDTDAGVTWFDTRADQSTPPTNITDIDVWITGSGADTTDPTVPSGLAASAITDTSFTVTWDAGTDNVGVTGYDWRINGGAAETVPATPRTLDFTDLTPATAYDVEIRSRDAAGNVSAYVPLEVTTDAGSSFPTHTIFDTPPGVLTKTVEASPYENATAFYTYTATPTGWKVKGARLYVPDGVTVPGTCEVNLYTGGVVPTLGAPAKTVTMTGIVSNAWNTVDFPSVTEVAPGEVWWIGIKFADGTWMGVEALSEDFVQSFDGSNFVLADRVPDVGLDRNYRRIGAGSTVALTGTGDRDLWFGMDATLEED